MYIKGQFKTFGCWFSLVACITGLCVLIYALSFGVDITHVAGILFFYFVLSILLTIYGKILYDANLISIDIENKKIEFTNTFTRLKSVYDFMDLDGKLVWYEPIRGGHIRNFYLIKNKKAIKKISGFIYSNQRELEEALSEIKDLGTTNYSYLKSWKVFFGFPIID